MGGKSKAQTTGFKYYMGLFMGLCHGPVDALLEIRGGDRTAWTGKQDASGQINIDAPMLYGGDEREGGLVGALDVRMGEPAQTANDYLTAQIGGSQPAYRGILSLVYRGGQIASNNPYVKPWAFRVRRILQGWKGGTAWYAAKAPILLDKWNVVSGAVSVSSTLAGAWSRTTDIFRDGNGGIGVYYDPSGVNGLSVGGTFKRDLLSSTLAVTGSTTITHQTGSPGDDRFWFRTGDKDGNMMGADDNTGYCEISLNGVYKSRLEQYAAESANWWYDEFGYNGNGAGGLLWIEAGKIYHLRRWGGSGPQLAYWASIPASGLVAATTYKATTLSTPSNTYTHLASDGTFYVYSDGDNKLYRWDLFANMLIEVLTIDLGGTFGMFAFAVHRGRILTLLATSSGAWALRIHNLSDGLFIKDVTGFTNPNSDCTKIIATDDMVYVKAGVKIYAVGTEASQVAFDSRAMNPAHIVYECLTNPEWGMGYDSSIIDDASFTAAADIFYAEGLGLCLQWLRQESIESFIKIVMDHAGAVCAEDRSTGLIKLTPIRGDYDIGTLPEFGSELGNVLEMTRFERGSITDAINEVTVSYTDAATGKTGSVTVQNLASVQASGRVISQSVDYPGLPTMDLALRTAMRDLRAYTSGLARVNLTLNRAGYALLPGDVIKFSWAPDGISQMVLRVIVIDYGSLTDGKITVECLEDVFGLPATTYVAQQASGWVAPDATAQAATAVAVFEAPYRELLGTLGRAETQALADESGYVVGVAARAAGFNLNYKLYTRIGAAAYADAGAADWCPTGTLVSAITPTSPSIVLTDTDGLDLIDVGTTAMLGSGATAEIVRVEAVNVGTSTVAIARGCLDTVPKAWAIATRFWAYDQYSAGAVSEYTLSEVVDSKFLTNTPTDLLAEASAPGASLTLAQRQVRPYPPAKLRFADVLASAQIYPAILYGAITTSWAHRDRLLQDDQIIDTEAATIGPEPSTTYTVRYYQPANTLVNTQSAISGAAATAYTFAADGTARITVEAVRAGYGSWQLQDHTFSYFISAPFNLITEAGDTFTTEDGDFITTE